MYGGMNSDEVIMGTTKAAVGLMLVLSSATRAQDRESQAPSLDLEKPSAKKTVAIDGLLNREPLEGAISNWTLSFEGSYSVSNVLTRAWQEGSSVVVMIHPATYLGVIRREAGDHHFQDAGCTTPMYRLDHEDPIPSIPMGSILCRRVSAMDGPQVHVSNPARRLGRRTDVGGHMTGRMGWAMVVPLTKQ